MRRQHLISRSLAVTAFSTRARGCVLLLACSLGACTSSDTSDVDGGVSGARDATVDSPARDGATVDSGDVPAPDGSTPVLDAGPPVITPDGGPPVFSETFDTLDLGDTWLSTCKFRKHARVTEGCGVGGSQCLRIAQDPFRTEPPLFPLPPVDARDGYPETDDHQCSPYHTNTATDVVQDTQSIPAGTEYSLSYDVFFEDGYDWARGGKLPGLSAAQWDSGCSVEGDGLSTDPGDDRWSVRLMWRGGGASELYVYDQDREPGACGSRSPTPFPFVTGRWIPVTIYVRLNSEADVSDGAAQMYFDGRLARDESGLRLRGSTSSSSRIRNIFFSTFFGGNESKRLYCLRPENAGTAPYCSTPDPMGDVTWVPEDVSYVRFDNIAVHEGLRVRVLPGQ